MSRGREVGEAYMASWFRYRPVSVPLDAAPAAEDGPPVSLPSRAIWRKQ